MKVIAMATKAPTRAITIIRRNTWLVVKGAPSHSSVSMNLLMGRCAGPSTWLRRTQEPDHHQSEPRVEHGVETHPPRVRAYSVNFPRRQASTFR